jgi:site-specific recombinase XerD
MTDLVVAERTLTTTDDASTLERVTHYALASSALSTRRAYASDLRDWQAWCDRTGATTLPATPESTAAYLAQLADTGPAVSTLLRRAAALAYAHRIAGFPSPTQTELVRAVLAGSRRELGVQPTRKAPATVDALGDLLAEVPATTAGRRDRALLLIGFAGAFRRSELVALDLEDIEEVDQGITVLIRRSKTDQAGVGRQVAIPHGTRLRPVQALREWLDASGIGSGPVFRPISRTGLVGASRLTDGSVARIIQKYASAAGLDRSIYSGHSLRAGFATSALDSGADLSAVASQLGHAKLDTTRIYDRRTLWSGHAGRKIL